LSRAREELDGQLNRAREEEQTARANVSATEQLNCKTDSSSTFFSQYIRSGLTV